ncbi:ModD protein [Pleomorphomonas sp. JP5]|uniref:ModD protein n=1 Tax=Pleomorphomonas sp. JP5 TaxID=2942998 RepID=UPI002044BB82|nr:ModD protein [Pleomorphomonas sp. JP5]MCM5558245.1 ModD protein [Pleomorphomonas sp. JP5]
MISRTEIERLLAEDVPAGDLTTDALGFGHRPGHMTFTARHDMVLAGIEVAAKMMDGLTVVLHAKDGDWLPAGTAILEARGPASALHRAWKAAQTLLEILSGIASATRAVVEAAAPLPVATTRKTVPGARALSQLAVRAGGGILHRHGLSETILVFPEHRLFLGGESLSDIAARLRRTQPEKALTVEVGTIDEAVEAAVAGFDVVQLEKFAPEAVAELVDRLPERGKRARIGAAGGIDPANAAAYAAAGADFIVTSWPYTARPRDVAVRLFAD